ncbi:MAG TPA: FKBP-type peptidyl-prolyl cis-trans isomerase [Jatrophihabitans sp.]|nr:FKBP-type peptidyl-prolyl cis-trans isomerase [Jatrophihabitans sp.]
MPTNQQRREAERRRLQRQLEERRSREAARKRTTLIASIVGTVVLIAVIAVVVILATNNSGKKPPAAASKGSPSDTVSSPSAAPSSPKITTPTAACAKPPKGNSASFEGVTVTGAKNLKHAPIVKSVSQQAPTTLQCQDLVVGTGKEATPTSTVSVQYLGVLYKNGTQFDASWSHGGKPISFSLTGVVPGFTQGIGGAGKVAPMRVGGRRIMILPASLGYGSTANGSIPANSSLVFVVDLTSVTG